MTMTTEEREPDEWLHLPHGGVLLQDQVLGYIAWRNSNQENYKSTSLGMGMSKGWVSDIIHGEIEVMKLGTRRKITDALVAKYGAAGIPIIHAKPITVPAPKPILALHRGFGRHQGDPTRPIIQEPLPEPEDDEEEEVEEYGVDREQDYLESLEAEVQDLTEGKTPRELAELLIQSRDHASSLQASLDIKMNQLNQATMRIAGLANQVTAMDNIRERMTAEVRERDFTIQGQAEDMVEYEKAMDVLRERVEDLEAFKARVGGALGGLHLVMHELTSSLPGGPSDELDAG
jgi:hypothetical protein